MSNKQIKLLLELAKRVKAEKRSRAQALATLQAAKILTPGGNFTSHYSNLKKVVSDTK